MSESNRAQVNRHPATATLYGAMRGLEQFPASQGQTDLSLLLGRVREAIHDALDEMDTLRAAIARVTEDVDAAERYLENRRVSRAYQTDDGDVIRRTLSEMIVVLEGRLIAETKRAVLKAWTDEESARLTDRLAAERERVDAILESFENPKEPSGMHTGAMPPPPSMRYWVRRMRDALRALPAPEATHE